MTKLRLDLSYSTDFSPIDMAKELKRKNIRKVKNSTLASQGLEDAFLSDENPVQEQLVLDNNKSFGGSQSSAVVDWASWLPFASKQYNISPNVADYVVVPIPTIITDVPNRNGVGFPLKELIKFQPHLGMQCYKTWKGKPTFEEHDNQDHTKAKGVILDTHMREMVGYGTWRLMKLLAFDRTRDPQLCADILSKKRNSYSMGAYVDGYTCSICHKDWGTCSHVPANLVKGQVAFLPMNGSILFKNVVSPEGFETSSVKTPAFISALNDNVFDMAMSKPNTEERDVIQMANLTEVLKNFKGK